MHNIITPPSAAACNTHTRQNGSMIRAVYAKSWSCHQRMAPEIKICRIEQYLRTVQSPSFGDHVPNCRSLVLTVRQPNMSFVESAHPLFGDSLVHNLCSELLFAYLWSSCQLEQVWCWKCFHLHTCHWLPVPYPFSVIFRHCMWAHIVPFWFYKLYIEKLQPHSSQACGNSAVLPN